MSTNPHEVTAILDVLRHAAASGRGALTPSDVEALQGVVDANAALVEALEAVLLFHSSSPWDAAKAARWDELAGANEATTKGLCNRVRAALAMATGEKP